MSLVTLLRNYHMNLFVYISGQAEISGGDMGNKQDKQTYDVTATQGLSNVNCFCEKTALFLHTRPI